MAVIEQHKRRSALKKVSSTLSPGDDDTSCPSSTASSSYADLSSLADAEVTPPQVEFTDAPLSSPLGEESAIPEMAVALNGQDRLSPQVAPAPAPSGVPALRAPTYIRGSGKKSSGSMLAPAGKRSRLSRIAVVVVTMLLVVTALGAVIPLTGDSRAGGVGEWINSVMHWSENKNKNTVLLPSQIATATAVTQDGYDPGLGNQTFAGLPTAPANFSGPSVPPSDQGSLNRFFYGQCTYWANYRYHELTGHYVPWLGNAYEWAYQAPNYGWVVSPTPHLPSIMVFQAGVQGAGGYGHVAIVESINGNDITTSNWNAGGAWATTTYLVNHPGAGVSFVYYPGA
jgi:surface antigen